MERLFGSLVPSLRDGLQDSSDDVKAVAADCLQPVLRQLSTTTTAKDNKLAKSEADIETKTKGSFSQSNALQHYHQDIMLLLRVLWDSLLQLDDLSSSTSSIMKAISLIYACVPQQLLQQDSTLDAASLLPRLFPYYAHLITSVRRTSVTTSLTLLQSINDMSRFSQSAWLILLTQLSHQLIQVSILDEDQEARDSALNALQYMVRHMTSPCTGRLLCDPLT